MNPNAVKALAIFVASYAIIVAGERSPRKLDRQAAGLLGGLLMVLCGVLTRAEAIRAVDFPTLALLFGMMVVIHYANESGLLDALGHRVLDPAFRRCSSTTPSACCSRRCCSPPPGAPASPLALS